MDSFECSLVKYKKGNWVTPHNFGKFAFHAEFTDLLHLFGIGSF